LDGYGPAGSWFISANGCLFALGRLGIHATVLLIGLVATHALAVANGLYMHGKINPSHHVGRLGLSLLLALAYSVLH